MRQKMIFSMFCFFKKWPKIGPWSACLGDYAVDFGNFDPQFTVRNFTGGVPDPHLPATVNFTGEVFHKSTFRPKMAKNNIFGKFSEILIMSMSQQPQNYNFERTIIILREKFDTSKLQS